MKVYKKWYIMLLLLLFGWTSLHANSMAETYLEKIKKHPDITFSRLVKEKLYPLDYNATGNDNSQIESAFIEQFADNNQTAIKISDTDQHEYFIAAKKYALAIYSVDDGFFKYAVLFNPDATISKIILLGYTFGNNDFHVVRDYKVGIARKITFLVDEKRFDRDEKNGEKTLSDERKYFMTLHPDAKLEIVKQHTK